MASEKGCWIAWIEPSGYEVVCGDNSRMWFFYPQPPLGMKWKDGPELDAMLKHGAKQIIHFVEPKGGQDGETEV